MAFPTNPYKNLPGDGIHIPEDLIQNTGEIPQRGTNGQLVAVPAGTVGQVPTYQADGTLAPANASGGSAAVPQFWLQDLNGALVTGGTTAELNLGSSRFNLVETGTSGVARHGTNNKLLTVQPGTYLLTASVVCFQVPTASAVSRFGLNDSSGVVADMLIFIEGVGQSGTNLAQTLVFETAGQLGPFFIDNPLDAAATFSFDIRIVRLGDAA